MKKCLLIFTFFFISHCIKSQTYASLPFFDDFESSNLSANWSANPDIASNGLVDVFGGTGINNSFGLGIGKTSDAGGFALNSVDLHLDLSGESNVFMTFAIREFYDENHVQDGIYMSDDGGQTFSKVYSFMGESWCNNSWGRFPPFNVDELASSAGLNLTGQFIIRFQQYDDGDFDTSFDEDGFIFDEVRVYTRAPQYASLPFEDNFDGGTGTLGANWSWSHADSTVFPIMGASKPSGLVSIVNGQGKGGTFGLMMGKICSDGFTVNALDLHLNLENESSVFFSFSIREFFDENHAQDAIYLSDDGGKTFQKAYSFSPLDWCDNVWGEFPPFNIDEMAASVGLSLTSQFIIRIQQYDDADFDTSFDEDGFVIDDVKVISRAPQYASLPFEDNFDNGTADLGINWSWSHADSTVAPLEGTVKPTGLVEIRNGQGTDGTFGLVMGKLCSDGFSANALDLHVNLENESNVFLSFSVRDFFEENHAQDALYFSNNGGQTFEKVYTFLAASWCDNSWGEFPPFNVDELAASVGLALTSQFIIRFQQYDDADLNTSFDEDGLILDNVKVFSRAPQYASLPFSDSFDDGTGILNRSWAWSHADSTVAPLEGTSKPSGFVSIVNQQGVDNTFGLMMGKRCSDGFTANALDLHLNLENESDVFLSFQIRDFFEENSFQDAMFFSNDGGVSFRKVYSFTAEDWCNNVWGEFPPFSIDDLAASVGLDLTSRFIIRLQQYDDADFDTSFDEDGFILDNVQVFSRSPQYASLPFCDDFDDGTGNLSLNWAWSHPDSSIFPLEETVKPTGFVGIMDQAGVDNTFGVMLGKLCDDGLTSNALDLYLNLANQQNVELSFSMRDFFDEANPLQDGIYFSSDGGASFERIYQFDFPAITNNVFLEYVLNLDSLVALTTLSYSSQSVIRFQQYDDADFNTSFDEDGYILDNIDVFSNGQSCGTVSIDDLDSSSPKIQLFPNPSSGKFSISVENMKPTEISITILNMGGQKIYTGKYSQQEIELDLSDLELRGMYVLKIEGEEFATIRKIIFSD
ncbi:MAG: T9SS type A sorting domain-containing protein [Bacteroidota bacterium]